jgi:quercetin dioxygenase-like cupin family protein
VKRILLVSCVILTVLWLAPIRTHSQTAAAGAHDHMVSQGCAAVPAGQKRPEFGCFIVASARGIQFSQPETYWHISKFPNRASAEASKTPNGLIVEEDGKVWLSEFGPDDAPFHGEPVAVVGPLELAPAKSYDAEIAYAALRPGDKSRVHTHPGPEAWYVISGSQCLETPEGTTRVGEGKTMSVKHSIPMELSITGTEVRRSLTLVIHDSSKGWGANSDWKPTGACGK